MKHIAALFALMGMSTMGWAQVETGTFSVIPRVGLNLSATRVSPLMWGR